MQTYMAIFRYDAEYHDLPYNLDVNHYFTDY